MIADARTDKASASALTKSRDVSDRGFVPIAPENPTQGDKTRQSERKVPNQTGKLTEQEIAAWLEPVEGRLTETDWKRIRAKGRKTRKHEDASKCFSIQMALRLTGAQQRAMLRLLDGASVTEAAQAAGVARQTLSYWLNHDIIFRGALSHARADAWEARLDAMRALGGDAVAALKGILTGADVPAAVKARAALGVLGLLADAAPKDPQMPGDFEREDEYRGAERILWALRNHAK